MTGTSQIGTPAAARRTGCDKTGMPAIRIVMVRRPSIAEENDAC